MLAGRGEVTEEQAQAAAAAFLDMDAARLQAAGRSEGTVPCWNFAIDDGDDTSYIAVTVSAGSVRARCVSRYDADEKPQAVPSSSRTRTRS